MKRFILLALVSMLSIITGSCSGDDSSSPIFIAPHSGEVLTMKFNGTYVAFDNVAISQKTWYQNISSQTITGIERGNPDNRISFVLKHKSHDQSNEIQDLRYYIGEERVFDNYQAGSVITVYNSHLLRGTFLGFDGDNEITEGTINLSF